MIDAFFVVGISALYLWLIWLIILNLRRSTVSREALEELRRRWPNR